MQGAKPPSKVFAILNEWERSRNAARRFLEQQPYNARPSDTRRLRDRLFSNPRSLAAGSPMPSQEGGSASPAQDVRGGDCGVPWDLETDPRNARARAGQTRGGEGQGAEANVQK
jgi:hypothetical protein